MKWFNGFVSVGLISVSYYWFEEFPVGLLVLMLCWFAIGLLLPIFLEKKI